MILGPEVALCVSLCTAPRKQAEWEMQFFASSARNSFDLASGMSLERKVKIDLEDINGVQWVDIQRDGNAFSVNVIVDELEFGSFEKITQREIELFDKYPDLSFSFQVTPMVALRNVA